MSQCIGQLGVQTCLCSFVSGMSRRSWLKNIILKCKKGTAVTGTFQVMLMVPAHNESLSLFWKCVQTTLDVRFQEHVSQADFIK